jgi:hypothetical protein
MFELPLDRTVVPFKTILYEIVPSRIVSYWIVPFGLFHVTGIATRLKYKHTITKKEISHEIPTFG